MSYGVGGGGCRTEGGGRVSYGVGERAGVVRRGGGEGWCHMKPGRGGVATATTSKTMTWMLTVSVVKYKFREIRYP